MRSLRIRFPARKRRLSLLANDISLKCVTLGGQGHSGTCRNGGFMRTVIIPAYWTNSPRTREPGDASKASQLREG